MANRIKSSQIEALKTKDQTVSEAVPGGGSLVARRLSGSTSWRYHYRHDGQTRKLTFGAFSVRGDSTGDADSGTYTLVGARRRAAHLSSMRNEVGDLVEHFADIRDQAKEAREQADQNRQQRKQQARDYSLAKLCEVYWKHLELQKKPSATEARNFLKRWVIDRQPQIANRSAATIKTQDVMTILTTVVDAGHTTTTNRVRSYLSAAFAFGAGSATDPIASSRAGCFNLMTNPVAATKRVSRFERAGDRVLTDIELATLLKRLHANEGNAAKATLLSLRLGGQRITQLLNVKPSDVDEKTITLMDGKGKRDHARHHVLPLTENTKAMIEFAIANPHPRRQGLYQGMSVHTVSKLVRSISTEMEADGVDSFTWRDLRRTCETMLSSMGISKDIRGQLLSHGLGGVQDKHYDRHNYLPEKTAALSAWNNKLDSLLRDEALTDNVVPLSR